ALARCDEWCFYSHPDPEPECECSSASLPWAWFEASLRQRELRPLCRKALCGLYRAQSPKHNRFLADAPDAAIEQPCVVVVSARVRLAGLIAIERLGE